ncbi:MAG: L,D-transpeptidase family protein [Bacteroidetes bacterium]|nr:L,D-transpeptidase family protein [Bacteroidota bacterium]
MKRALLFGITSIFIGWMLLSWISVGDEFLNQQKKYSRVRAAISEKEHAWKIELGKKDLALNNFEMLLVAFKAEDELQLFARKKGTEKYSHLKTYRICAKSGSLGPKRSQGDGQVPEGFYHIDRFNPSSNFYLSLGLNYPNTADQIKAVGNPGGDIFIHGSCVTIGCIPMTDDKIKEIYLLAVHARNNGQTKIPIYVFPFKMNDKNWNEQKRLLQKDSPLLSFWSQMKSGYNRFTRDYKPLQYTIDKKGDYQFP